MKGNTARNEERMLQLLADRATEGLDMVAARELNVLLASNPDHDEYAIDRAAAAINLASLPPVAELLPRSLRDRIIVDAGRFFGTKENRQHEQ